VQITRSVVISGPNTSVEEDLISYSSTHSLALLFSFRSNPAVFPACLDHPVNGKPSRGRLPALSTPSLMMARGIASLLSVSPVFGDRCPA